MLRELETGRLILRELRLDDAPALQAWPKSPNAVAGILRRLAPSLRGMEGLEVSFDRGGHAGTRRIVLTLKEAER